jgi:hypothetical protein
VASYSHNASDNVGFLGDRARELAGEEMARARSLDAKAAGITAASIALCGAGAAFVTRFAEVDGGSGAKALWAIELIAALVAALTAGGLSVWAIAPRVSRSSVHFREMRRWETPRVLEAEPVFNEGKLLRAAVHSVGLSRDVNRRKAGRLRWSSVALAVALASVVLLAASVAIHVAVYPALESRSKLRCQVQKTKSTSKSKGRAKPTGTTWMIQCSPSPISTSSSARDWKPRKSAGKTEGTGRAPDGA